MNVSWNIKLKSAFKFDLGANFAGVVWSALMQFVFVPLYLKYLGIEAFGLIGFYLILQAIIQVLDFGLSPTMNREMARYSVQPEKAPEARDLVRTLEAGYWLVGVAIGVVTIALAPLIATHWIRAGSIPVRVIQHTVMLMGVLAVFQWPGSFYQGGLMGLGRQVLFNGLNILFSTLSSAGSFLVLVLVSPTIQAFFLWLIGINALRMLVFAAALWRSLPAADRPSRFDLDRLRSIRRFAAGMTGISVCALILMQQDKLIVSKLFSLKILGYYSLAAMFGGGLSMIVTSVFNTIFPRFSALAASDENALRDLYYRSTELMAVLIFPLAAVLVLFSTQILKLWTRNTAVAQNAGTIMALLVIGSALNGLLNPSYALQLAYGWTSIGLRINIFLVCVSLPATWLLARHYGPVGAAAVWPALNAMYLMISLPWTHRRLLRGGAFKRYAEASLPLVPILLIALLGKLVIADFMSAPAIISVISAVLLCATAAAAFAAPSIRPWLISQIVRGRTSS